MKKLQLFTLVALLSSATYFNQAFALPWPFNRNTVTQTNTFEGNTIKRSHIGGNIQSNGTITINGQTYTGPVTIINGKVASPSNHKIIKDSGELETKKMNLAGVREISASGFGDLTIEQCRTCPETLTIVADKNIMPHLNSEVRNKRLTLGLKDNVSISTQTGVNYHAVVQDISKIETSGTLDIQSKGTLKTDTLKIETSGTGNITATVDVNNLNIDNSGTGTVRLSGKTHTQNVYLSGTGHYKADQLLSHNAKIILSGVAAAHVHVTNKLRYSLSGIGNIFYKGNPTTVEGSKSGLGKIRKA